MPIEVGVGRRLTIRLGGGYLEHVRLEVLFTMNKSDLRELIWNEQRDGPKHPVPRPDVKMILIESPTTIQRPIAGLSKKFLFWPTVASIITWCKHLPTRSFRILGTIARYIKNPLGFKAEAQSPTDGNDANE